MMKFHSKKIIISMLIVSLSISMIGCSAIFPVEEPALKAPLVKQSAVKYSTVAVERGEVEISTEAPARTEGAVSVKLSFTEASGRISYIKNTPGTVLKKGDIVAELDNDFIKKSLEQAKINLEKAKITYEELKKSSSAAPEIDLEIAKTELEKQRYEYNELAKRLGNSSNEEDKYTLKIAKLNLEKSEAEYKKLVESSGKEDAKLRLAKLDVEQQQLEVEKYEKELKNTILYSPVNGVIKEGSSVSIGDTVSVGTQLALVEDTSSVKIVARVNASEILDLKDGSTVMIKWEEKEYPATAREIKENEKDSDKPNFIFIPDREIPSLEAGKTLYFKFVKAKHTNVLRIPKNAVVIATGDTSGYATVSVLEDGIVVEKQVLLDLIGTAFVEVKSGLSEGELVVIR